MSGEPDSTEFSLPLPALERIDGNCVEFEAAWKPGEATRIEDYLGDVQGVERGELFRQLLLLDLDYRRLQGYQPSEEEYRGRFPDDGEIVANAFGEFSMGTASSPPPGSNEILGAPSYMAPEQAEGQHERVGSASDVSSLGAILYELLTGRPPFRAATPMETLRLVIDTEPVSPRPLTPQVPRDLETICLMAMAKEPGRRYPRARELADDLRCWLDGERIEARPASRSERLWRWCRRNPMIAGLTATAAFALSWLGGCMAAAFAKHVVPVLVEALKDEDVIARQTAAIALGRLGSLAANAEEKMEEKMGQDSLCWETVLTPFSLAFCSISRLTRQGLEPITNYRSAFVNRPSVGR